jgi:class 3 adenylate cyclase/ATP/maltotriose-dependent transcriptional regulator MalT
VGTCLHCGRENPRAARFCNACGAELPRAAMERRKLATLLFCDVTGSTALGERLDPEAVRELMLRYFGEMRTAIERHGGTVEKFIGDAVMAVFGVPRAREDDALRAVRAAAEMRDRLEVLNVELEHRYGQRIGLRIGINSGEVVTGAGTETIVTGDPVNIAARLEQHAGPGEILLGEDTLRLAGAGLTIEALDPIVVKGKSEPLVVYRLHSVSEKAGRRLRASEGELVGRGRELAALRDLYADAVVEGARLALVVGEPGVGKSRLARELVELVQGEARTLEGRCLAYGDGITYWPLGEVIRSAAGIAESDSREEALAKLERLVAGDEHARSVAALLARALGLEEGAASPEAIVWAARRAFEQLARERPLVVVIDDLHFAESALLDLVERLAAQANGPIMILGLSLPELLQSRPVLGREAIALEPLPGEESERLLATLAGDRLDEEARRRVLEAAGGNPLFVEELAAMLEEGERAARIPPTLEAVLQARLDRLTPEERSTLERAAIEGLVFDLAALTELSDPEERLVLAATLESLVEKGLVKPAHAGIDGHEAYAFHHALIRDAAYESAPKRLRAGLHERFARWLEEVAGDRLAESIEVVGYHLECAVTFQSELGPLDEDGRRLAAAAGERLAAAGRGALARGDVRAATSLLERAAALLPESSVERVELLLDLGAALVEAGALERAAEVFGECSAWVEEERDRRIEARLLLERSFLRRVGSAGDEIGVLLRAAEDAAATLSDLDDHRGLARAWRLASDVHWTRCRIADMEETLARGHEHARAAAAKRELSYFLVASARAALIGPLPVEQAIERCRSTLAEGAGDLVLEPAVSIVVAYLEAMRGRFDEARALASRADELLAELGSRVSHAALQAWASEVEFLAEDPAAAEAMLRPAYETLEAMGEKGNLSTIAALLAEAAFAQGRDEEAERLTLVSEQSAWGDDVTSQVAWRATRSKVIARRGELEEAEALARAGVAIAEATDAPVLQARATVSLAEVLLAAAQADAADVAFRRAIALYAAKGNIVAAAALQARVSAAV